MTLKKENWSLKPNNKRNLILLAGIENVLWLFSLKIIDGALDRIYFKGCTSKKEFMFQKDVPGNGYHTVCDMFQINKLLFIMLT